MVITITYIYTSKIFKVSGDRMSGEFARKMTAFFFSVQMLFLIFGVLMPNTATIQASASMIEEFLDGKNVTIIFDSPGKNDKLKFSIPKNATVLNATFIITPEPMEEDGSYTDSTDADFTDGTRYNITVQNNSIMLKLPDHPLEKMKSITSISNPTKLAIGDVNSDNINDIVVTNYDSNTITVIPGKGQGKFGSPITYPANETPYDIAIKDLDGDNLNDVVISQPTNGSIGIYYQKNKKLSNIVRKDTGGVLGLGPRGLAVGDLNNDNNPDIVVANSLSQSISIFYYDPAIGDFGDPIQSFAADLVFLPYDVAIGDFNGDNLNDVAVVYMASNKLHIFEQISLGGINYINTVSTISYSTGNGPSCIEAADLNGDGQTDVVVGNTGENTISIFYQNNGAFGSPFTYSTDMYPDDIAIGDIDGDGRKDIVVANHDSGDIGYFIYNAANKTFMEQKTIKAGTYPKGVAIGDLNSDFRLDVAVANSETNSIGIFYQIKNVRGEFIKSPVTTDKTVVSAKVTWSGNAYGQRVNLYASSNGGSTWTKLMNGIETQINDAGTKFMYKIELITSRATISPIINSVDVKYHMKSYPTDVVIDIGKTGTADWAYPGSLKNETVIDGFEEPLNKVLEKMYADEKGNSIVPIEISSDMPCIIHAHSLSILYNRAPTKVKITYPKGNVFVASSTPKFRFISYDADGDNLKYTIEISSDNFKNYSNMFSINQSKKWDDWNREDFPQGTIASYTLQEGDALRDGQYFWKAYAYDGFAWSESSEVATFIVDTTPPENVTVLINDGENYTSNPNVVLHISANDKTSGVENMSFSDDGSTWTPEESFSHTKAWKLKGKEGKKVVYTKIIDKARNSVVVKSEIIYDTSPPEGCIKDDGKRTSNYTSIHFILEFEDELSGVVLYKYSIGTSPGKDDVVEETETNESEVTVTNLKMFEGKTYYINARAKNGAGLWSEWISSDGITVDTDGPSAEIRYPIGRITTTEIKIEKDVEDINNLEIIDGDLEYRYAVFKNGKVGKWSDWEDVGKGDGGDRKVKKFEGERGYAYQFRYRAKNEIGSWGDFSKVPGSVVINRLPHVEFTISKEFPSVNEKVEFRVLNTTDEDGDSLNITWIFSDGTSEKGQVVYHKFKDSGDHFIKLIVNDSWEEVSYKISISVKEKKEEGLGVTATIGIGILALLIIIGAVLGAYFIMRKKKKKDEEQPPLSQASFPHHEEGVIIPSEKEEEIYTPPHPPEKKDETPLPSPPPPPSTSTEHEEESSEPVGMIGEKIEDAEVPEVEAKKKKIRIIKEE